MSRKIDAESVGSVRITRVQMTDRWPSGPNALSMKSAGGSLRSCGATAFLGSSATSVGFEPGLKIEPYTYQAELASGRKYVPRPSFKPLGETEIQEYTYF